MTPQWNCDSDNLLQSTDTARDSLGFAVLWFASFGILAFAWLRSAWERWR